MTENELPQINPHDKEIINQIEGIIGRKLKQVTETKFVTRGYLTNNEGKVIGLSFFDFDIDDAMLQNLSEQMSYFSNLILLYLNLNQIRDISPLKTFKNLKRLDIRFNNVDDITCLKQLSNLSQVDIGYNQLSDISVLKELPNLVRLDISSNQIVDISVLENMQKLKTLNLGDNKFTDISSLSSLSFLTQLGLTSSRLNDVSYLNSLTSLTTLYLGSNKISDLSKLVSLRKLENLYLHDNQISDLSPISSLKKLKELTLNRNQLTDISALATLTNLTRLALGENNLTDFSVLSSLKNLRNLDLNDTQINDISIISHLTKLKHLHLIGNKLSDISALSSLSSLISLDLRSNKLTDISVLKRNPNLIQLDLHNNQLKNIPVELFEKKWKVYWKGDNTNKGMNLFGNPLETPPIEIVKQGREAVLNYFKFLDIAEKVEEVVKLYEAKLLVVGPGGVGKTFLSNRLIYGKTPPIDTTEGIDIHKWMVRTSNIDNFRINLWDFGGQEIYHATHQFFLTKRSLYLFVWEARKDDDRVSFSYWLNVIKLLSNGAPVIMVMNKCDERRKPIDQAAIQKQFPNVIGFYEVSAEQSIGIDDLQSKVIEEIGKLEQIGTTLPKQWVNVREQLEGMKGNGQNYISYKQYQEICCSKIHGLDEKQAGYLAGYYHELGIILHFSENPILKDIVFLNPEWATDAVYVLTDYEPVKKNFGRFHFEELKGVWKDYPEDKYAALLELMMKFELCFNLEGTDEYIIPELLRPQKCFFEWNCQDNLNFQYKYDFMPAGIITRFMVRKHNLIKDNVYWKNGVVMEWEGTKVLIESNEFDGKIDIWINGEDKKGLLSIIRCEIQHIHETLNKPVVSQRMPCICSECKESTDPYFYKYSDLRTLLRKNVREIRCMKSAEEILIDDLLGTYGIYDEEKEQKRKCNDKGDNNMGDTYNIYADKVSLSKDRKHVEGDYVEGTQNKTINIEYNNKYGLTPDEFKEFIDGMNKLSNNQMKQLKGLYQQLKEDKKGNDKESLFTKIKNRLIEFGIGTASSLNASGILALASLF